MRVISCKFGSITISYITLQSWIYQNTSLAMGMQREVLWMMHVLLSKLSKTSSFPDMRSLNTRINLNRQSSNSVSNMNPCLLYYISPMTQKVSKNTNIYWLFLTFKFSACYKLMKHPSMKLPCDLPTCTTPTHPLCVSKMYNLYPLTPPHQYITQLLLILLL